jgi:hypothetical protein
MLCGANPVDKNDKFLGDYPIIQNSAFLHI